MSSSQFLTLLKEHDASNSITLRQEDAFFLAEIFSTVFFQKAEIITVAAHFFPTLFVLPPGADGSVACSVGLA